MTSAPDRPIDVHLLVDPGLLRAECREGIVGSVTDELSHICERLGVPAAPDVKVTAAPVDAPGTPVTLHIEGRRCPNPRLALDTAAAYVKRQQAVERDALGADALAAFAESVGAEGVSEFVALVCRAAVNALPSVVAPDEPVAASVVALGIPAANGADSQDVDPEAHIAASSPQIDIHVEPGYLRALAADDPMGEIARSFRDGITVEVGLGPPAYHIRRDDVLHERGVAFRLHGLLTVPFIGLQPGWVLVNGTTAWMESLNIDAEPTVDPVAGQPAVLIRTDDRETAEQAGYTTWGPAEFVHFQLADLIRRHAASLVTTSTTTTWLEDLVDAPFLIRMAREQLSLGDVTGTLRALAKDGVSILNRRRIVELLLRHDALVRGGQDPGVDPVTYTRRGLDEEIASRLGSDGGTVVVYLLDPALESQLGQDTPDGRGRNAMMDQIEDAVDAEIAMLPPSARLPALLVADDARDRLATLLRPRFPRLAVIGFADLPATTNVQPVARIEFADAAATEN